MPDQEQAFQMNAGNIPANEEELVGPYIQLLHCISRPISLTITLISPGGKVSYKIGN